MFYLRTLGQLSLHAADPNSPPILAHTKPLAVLALLATMPEHSGSREYIAELLWPGLPLSRARRSLRQTLFQLSRRTRAQLVLAGDDRLALDPEKLEVDLWAFDRALKAGQFERAVELCGGLFLEGFEHKAGGELARWIEAQNERIRTGLEVAYAQVIAAALERGDTETAVQHAKRWAERNPLDDQAQTTLIRTLKAAGDELGALQVYEAYRALLRRELQDEPSQQLEKTIAVVRETVLTAPDQPRPEASVPRATVRTPGTVGHDRLEPGLRFGLGSLLASAVVGAVTAAAVLALVLTARTSRLGEARPVALDDLRAGFFVVTSDSSGPGTVEVVVDGPEVRVQPAELNTHDLQSPDGSAVVFQETAVDGFNLAVKDLRTGEVRALTTERFDEYPCDWSPDGRRLLYVSGNLSEDRRQWFYRLAIHDLDTAERRWLTDVPITSGDGWAVWSPDGTRIAFVGNVEGNEQLFVVNVDGSQLRRILLGCGRPGRPAWSPDGQTLVLGARDPISTNLFTVRQDGADLRRVTTGIANDITPTWLSDAVVAFVSDRGGNPDVWALDLLTGEMRQLTTKGGMVRIVRQQRAFRATGWIDTLCIKPRAETVTPGQQIQLQVEITDSKGHPVAAAGIPLKWSVSDSSVASITQDGKLEVRSPGSARVMASAAGWRADTLEIASYPLTERHLQPAFVEDWRHSLRSDRWILYGDPLPYTRPTGGPDGGGIFVSNGDESFASGIVSRRKYGLRAGITVEAWGRMPFTGKHYETFSIELWGKPPPADSIDWRPSWDPVFMGLQVNGQSRRAYAMTKQHGYSRLPFPSDPGSWHRYALQLEADGTVSLVVDSQLQWRSPWQLPVLPDDSVHIGLGDRSLDSEIMHGPLRVYLGAKYLLPQDLP